MSFSHNEFIEDWLEQVLSASSHLPVTLTSSYGEEGRSIKRRKISHLISPSQSSNGSRTRSQALVASMDQDVRQDSSKRKAEESVDNSETPRPKKTTSSTSIFRNTPSLSSQSNASRASGQSSPTKSFPVQGYNNHRLDSVTMDPDNDDMPADLARLLDDMHDFSTERNIIPDGLKDEVAKRSASDRSLRRLRNDAYYESAETGSSPADTSWASRLFLTARKLVKRAGQCHHLQYDETAWNHLVHTPLLDAVLKDDDPTEFQLVDFSPCMNASIRPSFHKFPIPSSKVDYVFYLDPAAEDASVSDALAKLEGTGGSVNHTTFRPLSQYPISLSIETKRHGGDGRKADLQMAAWQAAQWSFLEEHSRDAINGLTFLPGVIVQGHEWKCVATTWMDGKTTLWSSHQFGTTMTLVGVFQIMAGLRRLRRWSVEVFWPWYKRNVLHLDVRTDLHRPLDIASIILR